MDKHKGKPSIIILVAVVIVALVSLVPWSELTGGTIKDFNLLGDIIKAKTPPVATANEQLDPELQAALDGETMPGATVVPHSQAGNGTTLNPDTSVIVPKEEINPIVDGKVIIEDYTPVSSGLQHLKAALNNPSKTARVAVIGDSYIEGDILTMNIREALQDKFGGSGVGYMPLSSPLTGFRTSVRQKCDGWTISDIRKSKNDRYKWLSGEWFTATSGATASYKGTSHLKHLKDWNNSKLLYIAPQDGNITVTTESGSTTYPVTASEDVQMLAINSPTSSIEYKIDAGPLVALGAWLDGNGGIAVDNMSLRGNSGISHRSLNPALAEQMRKYIDYDCIIVEYGINALSSQQSDYSGYGKLMTNVIARLKACYPNADIIIMGIGDRGQKIEGTVESLPTSASMVKTQRNVARNTGVHFWDTRAAMGGTNAVVDWRKRGLINADYIHLNAKGGAELARIFVSSLESSLK